MGGTGSVKANPRGDAYAREQYLSFKILNPASGEKLRSYSAIFHQWDRVLPQRSDGCISGCYRIPSIKTVPFIVAASNMRLGLHQNVTGFIPGPLPAVPGAGKDASLRGKWGHSNAGDCGGSNSVPEMSVLSEKGGTMRPVGIVTRMLRTRRTYINVQTAGS
ncbi:hypothetical protein PIB30_022924 [Stylosanthes scabra]|uniref:Uncharacterized protein n=1 Tax=Stylosanthes scabra TaxID=79078 RepID=A0ABU6QAQ7_9FABA|nr:hypothetical protein [Stylosanthes scabra]